LTIGYTTIIIVIKLEERKLTMSQEMYIKIADEISDELIKNKNNSKKTILELYSELLNNEYREYYYDILSYIPERLSVKGYEIINSKYFELKKY
jgi:CII-binding regulator of phage lambda lysogenization HflD